MNSLPAYRLVDVFVGEGALGNRAAVVMSSELPDAAGMQRVAAGIGAPATAFVGLDTAHVRWFSPRAEITLCGHGALAAGRALLAESGGQSVTLHSGDGRSLVVRSLAGEERYEIGLPAIRTDPVDLPGLVEALGAVPDEVRWHADGYALAIYRNARTVREIRPDRAALAALGNWQVSVSAHGDVAGADIVSRVFSGGGVEDAATGSAHAALAPYWCGRLGKGELTAFQASPEGGRLACRLDGDTVWVGGKLAAYGSG